MHNCLLPHFLLATYIGYAEENGHFQISKHRLKFLLALIQWATTAQEKPPDHLADFLQMLYCGTQSLFANVQWLVTPRSGWQRGRTPFPSTGRTTHFHNNHFPTSLARSFLLVISGLIQEGAKQLRGWWWSWCPWPAVFLFFLSLSLKKRGNQSEKGKFADIFVVRSASFAVRAWRSCTL